MSQKENNIEIKKLIQQLECALLEPSVRQSTDEMSKLIADDFIEFGSSGKVYNKQDILEFLPIESTRKFIVTDFEIKELAGDVMLATYKTIENGMTALRSSIWKQYGDDWCMIFHQGTKCEIKVSVTFRIVVA